MGGRRNHRERDYPRFREIIDEYIVPMEDRGRSVCDSTYFLRRDDSFVFCEGYCHPRNAIYGKIIYHPREDGWIRIHGRPYECITKRRVDDRIVYVTHPDQIRRQLELDPTLEKARPPFALYELEFPLKQFAGYFDCKKSLRKGMTRYPFIERAAREVCDILDVPLERMGVTGSLAYGVYDPDDEDFDVVFFGTVEENRRVVKRIYEITRDPAKQVIEFNRLWPMRFRQNGVLVCPFFVYSDWNEVPLREFSIDVLKETVDATGRVCDDSHSIYMPSILQLDSVTIDGNAHPPLPLIIYDGALRGDFRTGDAVRCSGMSVKVTRGREEFEALLVNLCNQIEKTA